jgi:hypothetical protein
LLGLIGPSSAILPYPGWVAGDGTINTMTSNDYSSGPAPSYDPSGDVEDPGGETAEVTNDGDEGASDGKFFLPADVLGGRKCKAGDKLSLEVLGMDSGGDYEVRLSDDSGTTPDDMSMADTMRSEIKGGAGSALRSARQTNSEVM